MPTEARRAGDWRPRLTIEVTKNQYNRLKPHLMHGIQKPLLMLMINDIIELIEEFGPDIIMRILLRDISYKDVARYGITKELTAKANFLNEQGGTIRAYTGGKK